MFRTRYAGLSLAGAARERYLDDGLYIPKDHAGHFLTHLVTTRPFRVLDLRTEANLDALDVDDQISTSHHLPVQTACHELADAARRWWEDLDGLVYRSRTTPMKSVNIAFFSLDGLKSTSTRLSECGAELDDLVLHHQFTVGFDY